MQTKKRCFFHIFLFIIFIFTILISLESVFSLSAQFTSSTPANNSNVSIYANITIQANVSTDSVSENITCNLTGILNSQAKNEIMAVQRQDNYTLICGVIALFEYFDIGSFIYQVRVSNGTDETTTETRVMNIKDNLAPNISLIDPTPNNNEGVDQQGIRIVANVTEHSSFGNCTIEWHYSNTTIINETMSKSSCTNGLSCLCSQDKTLNGGRYCFKIFAKDIYNNTGSTSLMCFDITIDTEPPSIFILSPYNGTELPFTTSVKISFLTNEIADCYYSNQENFELFEGTFISLGKEHSFDKETKENTTYNLYYRCKDLSNNTSPPVNHKFKVAAKEIPETIILLDSNKDWLDGKETEINITRGTVLNFFQKKNCEFKVTSLQVIAKMAVASLDCEGDLSTIFIKKDSPKEIRIDSDDKTDIIITLKSLSADSGTIWIRAVKPTTIKSLLSRKFFVVILILILAGIIIFVFLKILKYFKKYKKEKKEEVKDVTQKKEAVLNLVGELDEAIKSKDYAKAKQLYKQIKLIPGLLSDRKRQELDRKMAIYDSFH